MASFQDFYRAIFETFGYPLSERTALGHEVLAAAETRLGVRIPAALRDYYLVAGREKRFNTCCERLRPPSEWEVDKQRLVFMDENQAASVWGVSIRNPDSVDPPVSEGVEDESTLWYPAQRKCSVFLVAMLHHQAVSGGFGHNLCEFFDPSKESAITFDKKKWNYCGELKGGKMYSRPGHALCLAEGRRFMIQAGGKTKRDLQAIAAELGLSLE